MTEKSEKTEKLRPFLGKTVNLQLREPYQLVVARDDLPVTALLVQTPEGIRLARTDAEEGAQPVGVPTLLGLVVEVNGLCMVEVSTAVLDRGLPRKVRIYVDSDAIAFVSVLCEPARILVPSG